MKLSDFDFVLPPALIAQEPASKRADARLLCVPRADGEITHRIFRDITGLFRKGDVLVLNNTKVIPARIIGKRQSGGHVEALLLKEQASGEWEALVKPSRRLKAGEKIEFGENGLRISARMADDCRTDSGMRMLKFDDGNVLETIKKIGHMPLPPYLGRKDHEHDRVNYQTVFAERDGAVAAPTAGLHFDEALLKKIADAGVEIVYVTLHTSYGTFQPISDHHFKEKRIFEESFEVSEETAGTINRALKEKRRVIACGTTTMRTLESAAVSLGKIAAKKGVTDIFIFPPYEFKIASGLITNFHLPKSSLLCLVAAFMNDRERLLELYREAIERRYRFYSYGDAMLIL